VKPSYPKHRKVRSVSRDARLLNIHLWNLADDDGRLQELIQWIIGEVFPEDEDVTPVLLREWLGELSDAGLIIRYEAEGEPFIQCVNFRKHQVINKPRPSEIPPPQADSIDSRNSPVVVPEPSDPEREVERDKEEEGEAPAGAGAQHQNIFALLDRVAFARGVSSPKVEATDRACESFSHLDLTEEAEKFAHYWIDGPGEKRALDDVSWKWRQWLERSQSRPQGQDATTEDFSDYDAVMEPAA
jgi:hypothetical protein